MLTVLKVLCIASILTNRMLLWLVMAPVPRPGSTTPAKFTWMVLVICKLVPETVCILLARLTLLKVNAPVGTIALPRLETSVNVIGRLIVGLLSYRFFIIPIQALKPEKKQLVCPLNIVKTSVK